MDGKRKRDEESPAPQVSIVLNGVEQAFLMSLPERDRVDIMLSMQSIQSAHQVSVPLRFRILASKLPESVKQEAFLRCPCESLSPKYLAWLEVALSIPIGVCQGPLAASRRMRKRALSAARAKMDKVVVGHGKAKDGVMRVLSQMLCGERDTVALGLSGPPGIGKTTFAQQAMSVLGRPIVFVSLGGASDSTLLTGHSYTYEGAACGRVVDALREAKCMDPVIYFDELDKVSETPRGAEIVNTLVHLIDPSQNAKFRDKYLGFDLDLSRATFVFSYNNPARVCPVLLDRIACIDCAPPSVEEKLSIARKHLIPRCIRRQALKDPPALSDETLRYIVERHTEGELGVRNLERCLNRLYGSFSVWELSPDALAADYRFERAELGTDAVDRVLQEGPAAAPAYAAMFT